MFHTRAGTPPLPLLLRTQMPWRGVSAAALEAAPAFAQREPPARQHMRASTARPAAGASARAACDSGACSSARSARSGGASDDGQQRLSGRHAVVVVAG
jgi:hypothetical protein